MPIAQRHREPRLLPHRTGQRPSCRHQKEVHRYHAPTHLAPRRRLIRDNPPHPETPPTAFPDEGDLSSRGLAPVDIPRGQGGYESTKRKSSSTLSFFSLWRSVGWRDVPAQRTEQVPRCRHEGTGGEASPQDKNPRALRQQPADLARRHRATSATSSLWISCIARLEGWRRLLSLTLQ
jgi:hypothetical protein